MILVAAPAGFGKSTLLGAWLEACDCPHAWLCLDEHDSDLGVFLAYFLGAVRTIFPTCYRRPKRFCPASACPPWLSLPATSSMSWMRWSAILSWYWTIFTSSAINR